MIRSPRAPPGLRRASWLRRGWITSIAHDASVGTREMVTRSPTVSLSGFSSSSPRVPRRIDSRPPPRSCASLGSRVGSRLSRPRNDTSSVSPLSVRTCQTPPVPCKTTASSEFTFRRPATRRRRLRWQRLPTTVAGLQIRTARCQCESDHRASPSPTRAASRPSRAARRPRSSP